MTLYRSCMAAGSAETLSGGNVSGGVVRIGDTVRRPAQETSAGVAEYLRHLESRALRELRSVAPGLQFYLRS